MSKSSVFSVKLVNTTLVPDVDAARALVKALKTAAESNEELREALANDPRSVLADRGLPREYQNEFLTEIGQSPSLGATAPECGCTGCCATSSFCCETV